MPDAVAPAEEPGFEGLQPEAAPTTKESADPGFENLSPVSDEGFQGLQEADKLDVTPHKDLISDYSFSPGEYLANNPKVTDEPERLQKLLDVYRAKRAAGLPLTDVAKSAVKQAPGIIAKTAVGARDLVQRVGDFAIQPAFNKIAGKLIGDSPEIQRGTMEETGKEQLKAGGEITAGTESAISGLAQLGQQGYRKLAHSVSRGKPMNDSELLNELYVDSEFSKAMKDAASGSGEGAKFAGLDADTLQKNGVTLDKDAIENLSLVDPLTIAATGGVFRVLGAGGKILATAASEPAAKMVLSGLEKVASHAQNLAAGTVKLAGKGITAAGSTTEAVGHSMGGLSAVHQLSEGNVLKAVGSMAVPFVAKPVGKGIQAAGRAISEVGESLPAGFIGPKTAAAARLSDIAASAPVQAASNVVGSAAKGAAAGAAAAAPLAAASDNPDTAGGILGGGAALGAAHAALPATAKTAENLIASHYLDPKSVDLSPVKSPGYGVDPNLDAAHEAAMKSISSPERVAINNFREATRNAGGEIYALSQADYTKKLAEMYPNASPEDLQKYSDTHAVFDAPSGDRRVVFLNSDAKGLPHDAGHLFQGLLDPDQQAFLRESVFQNYTPEAIKTFGDAYAARLGQPDYFSKLGETAARNKIADELIAENYSQLFGNNSLEKLAAPKKFLSELGRSVVGWAEGQGLDLTAGRKTPDLNAKPSYQLQNVLRNGAREVLNKVSAKKPTPKPLKLAPGEIPTVPKATPPTPADIAPVPKPTGPTEVGTPSGARNIRATAEHQNDFASARAEDTGIAEAQKAVESDPDTRATVDAISNSMQAGNPALEIEHRGIASERGPGNPEGRTSRRGTQASGYEDLKNLLIENRANAPEDIVNTHQKTFVPVRWTSQGGKPTLIAMSIDKVISNIHRVVADAAKNNASDLLPYPTENGKLTSAGWQKVVSDVKTYAENQSNGFRGDGQKLVRPTSDIGVSLPAENPDYTPKPLSEAEANFANLVQGIAPPETGRATKGTTPGNVKGQLLAEINARQPLTPTVIKPEHITKQGFKEFPGRSVKEMNPLRNELASRGVKVRELHEVTERLAAQDIATVKPRPDLDIKAPVTDTIRAGFLPGDGSVESRGDQIMKTSPEDWVKLTASWKGGLTPEAYRMGLGLKDPVDVGRLASLRDSASDQFKTAMKSGDFDNASAFATKAQFFSEAHGAAMGTGSAKNGVRMTGFSEPHPFPADENTGSTQAPAEKAGDVQRMQKGELERNFLPASEAPEGSDPITEAAVRTKGGKVFTGSWHGEAMTKFADAVAKGELNEPLPAGVKTLTDFLDMVQDGSQPAGAIEDGFVTKSGQFLNRAQALDHAEKIGQLKEPQGPGRGSFAKEGLLEANEFKGRRNFLPADEAGAKDKKAAKLAWAKQGTESPYFKKWFSDSKVVDEDGSPVVVYHGTTHKFNEFSGENANVENNLGKGFYFTNSQDDLLVNYAGSEGLDLTQRIERRAEQLENEENLPRKKALEQAKKQLVGKEKEGRVIKAYLKLENPVKLGGERETHFDYQSDPDTGEESGTYLKLLSAITRAASDFDSVDSAQLKSDLSEHSFDGGVSARQFEKIARESDASQFTQDSDSGNLAVGEFIRRVFEEMGYDGIIDRTVSKKFPHMPGVYENTTHYVAFRPEQVKSVENKGEFRSDTADIRYLPKDRVSPDHKVESEKGYLYHATNEENAEDIARGSLQVHHPDFGTDQDSWPDGSTQKRAYFIDRANQAWHFAPDHGKSVLLRAKQSDQFKKESTGDFFTTTPVPAGSLEILTSGGWRPLSENSPVDSGVSAGDISQKKD